MHVAAVASVVVDCFMPEGAVVPNGYVVLLPADAALVIGVLAVGVQERQQGGGFGFGQSFDVCGESWVHVKGFAP